MNEVDVVRFGTVDFVVFIGLLGSAILVGIYYAWKDRNSETMETYYFGGRNMSPIPVGLSISVTFISAITLITFPAETYLFGTASAWFCFAMIIPMMYQCLFYIPLCHRLHLSSLYEYLERRFDHRVRKIASSLMCFAMLIFMSMTVYIPGLALSAVTPMSISLTCVITGATCTFYTTLGGMKAVVWADTIQTGIMLAGCVAVLIRGTMLVGGFGEVWTALDEGERLNMMNFDPDPRIRTTFWTVIVGCSISWSTPNQAIIQRFLACSSVKKARQAALVSLLPSMIFIGISIWNGAIMYAYYKDCDLLMSEKIEKTDQMMPYMVLDIFQDLPGMGGLFVAAAFSGTLSTVSSGINSLASLLMEDFILYKWPKMLSPLKMSISKGIVLGFGVLVTCLALAIMNIDGTVFQIGYTFYGASAGPLLGVFAMAMFLPWCTTTGVLIGQAIGTVITAWIAIGGFLYGKSPSDDRSLPASVEGCSSYNETVSTTYMTTNAEEIDHSGLATTLYAISFLYYGLISLIITVTFGLIASFATGASKPSEADPHLFIPIISNPIFPMKVREFFRFGVPKPSTRKSNISVANSEDSIDGKDYLLSSNGESKHSNRHDEETESKV